MLLSNVLLPFALFAAGIQGRLFIVKENYSAGVGTGNTGCRTQISAYRIMSDLNQGIPPIKHTCDKSNGGFNFAVRWGSNLGTCSANDYYDDNGTTWKFCPDGSGGGRLENMGVTPGQYRQCYAERPGYEVSKCMSSLYPVLCWNYSEIIVWCKQELSNW